MPQFPGEDKALTRYLSQNVKYPVQAQKQGIQGTAVCRFIVASTGEIKNAVIVKSVFPLIDKEVIRLVSSMPEWIPGKQNGKAVDVYLELSVKYLMQK